MRRILIHFLLSAMMFNSCVAPQNPRMTREETTNDSVTGEDSRTPSSGEGNPASEYTEDDVTGDVTQAVSKVEITQIVDPNTGTFRKKVSIPKDFEGYLYLSGLNITALKEKIISVRFNLGREKTSVTIPAVIGRVPGGLTPLSSIDVIILDVQNKPFRHTRLLYDLFDYNDYQEKSTSPLEPTDDPTNAGLYCRGLEVGDDPTFIDNPNDSNNSDDSLFACDEAGDTCLYAYAKIQDQTLYKMETDADGNNVLATNYPAKQQIDVLANGYASETSTENLQKCLPDTEEETYFNGVLDTSVGSLAASFSLGIDSTLTQPAAMMIGGTQYYYQGPYKPYSYGDWEITGTAIFHPVSSAVGDVPNGIFQDSLSSPSGSTVSYQNVQGGFNSLLFPRAGKINFSQAGVEYFGSDSAFTTNRSLNVLPAAGDTKWMDGCNIRTKNYDKYTGESIASCNVTATIEIITMVAGKEEVLVTSKDVKLQLIKEGLGETVGESFSAMKTCDSSRACGTGECCFNSRCWSRELVGQCGDDFSNSGNLGTGQNCGSDLDCSSLCCNATTGVCADHINNDTEQVLCTKVPGQTCITKEFCRKENVKECFIIRTTDANGNPSCERKCYNVPTFGDCLHGICQPPKPPAIPSFDPTDPNRCNRDDIYDKPPIIL